MSREDGGKANGHFNTCTDMPAPGGRWRHGEWRRRFASWHFSIFSADNPEPKNPVWPWTRSYAPRKGPEALSRDERADPLTPILFDCGSRSGTTLVRQLLASNSSERSTVAGSSPSRNSSSISAMNAGVRPCK